MYILCFPLQKVCHLPILLLHRLWHVSFEIHIDVYKVSYVYL